MVKWQVHVDIIGSLESVNSEQTHAVKQTASLITVITLCALKIRWQQIARVCGHANFV